MTQQRDQCTDTHGVALVVRNTFLHYGEEEKGEQSGRSSSAPPSCRTPKGNTNDFDATASTACDSFALDTSTLVTDSEEAASQASGVTEHEGPSAPMTPDNLEMHGDKAYDKAVDPQEQLDRMSEMVMDIWSKLRKVESSIEAAPSPLAKAKMSWADESIEESQPPAQADASPCQKKLVANSRPFVPGIKVPETFHSILTMVAMALRSALGVADVEMKLGPPGTLATLAVKLARGASAQAVMDAVKAVLLDVTANSESTYVLGYANQPFQDDPHNYSFCTSLASMPPNSECTVCWDTYTYGCCPRPRVCKYQHPARTALQPLKVVVK